MAITFIQKKEIQRYLILVFIVILLIITTIIWQGFFKKEKPPSPEIFKPAKKIEINFEVLKNPILEELQLFEVVAPFEEEIGRENPFIPY